MTLFTFIPLILETFNIWGLAAINDITHLSNFSLNTQSQRTNPKNLNFEFFLTLNTNFSKIDKFHKEES